MFISPASEPCPRQDHHTVLPEIQAFSKIFDDILSMMARGLVIRYRPVRPGGQGYCLS